MADRFVLDAFALLAYLQDEPSRPRIETIFGGAASGENEVSMSVVNLGEVMYQVERRRGLQTTAEVLDAIDHLPIRIIEASRPLALQAARLKANHSLGYADCFAAALARELGATVLTGDQDFTAVEGFIPIEWLLLAGAT